jgi:hypothetical protein
LAEEPIEADLIEEIMREDMILPLPEIDEWIWQCLCVEKRLKMIFFA